MHAKPVGSSQLCLSESHTVAGPLGHAVGGGGEDDTLQVILLSWATRGS